MLGRTSGTLDRVFIRLASWPSARPLDAIHVSPHGVAVLCSSPAFPGEWARVAFATGDGVSIRLKGEVRRCFRLSSTPTENFCFSVHFDADQRARAAALLLSR